MSTFLLIRHGENEYVTKGRLAGRQAGVHLNENGRAQALKLMEALAKAPITAVYSSPMERTIETAEPIAQSHNLEVISRPGLIEIDYGDWQNKTLKQLRRWKLWKAIHNTPSMVRFPRGETFNEAQARIVREIEDLRSQHKPKDLIVCVSHSDPIKLGVAYYLGLPLDLFQRLAISPASISTLHINESGPRLININQALTLKLEQPGHKQ